MANCFILDVLGAELPTTRYSRRYFKQRTRDPGGAGRDRTDDLKLAKLPLSQLSYGPYQDTTYSTIIRKTGRLEINLKLQAQQKMVGLGRLELPTSRLSGVRSNHLSYRPPNAISVCSSKRKRNEDGGNPAVFREIASET